MKFLLLLLGVSFFFIFFLFSHKSLGNESLFQNIFLEANIYIFVSLFFIYITFFQEKKQREKNIEHTNQEGFLHSFYLSIQGLIRIFFRDIVYYVSIILFYIGFYLVFGEFFGNLEISQIFFLFNLLVVFLFFLEHKIFFFGDLLRVNTSIISLYYIFFHILYIFGFSLDFSLFDIGNIFCVLLLLYLFVYNSSGKNYKNIFYVYMLSFIFLEICVALKYFFGGENILYTATSFLFALTLSLFPEVLKKISKIPLRISRLLSLLFFALSISLSFIAFGEENISSIVFVFISAVSSLFLFSFHRFFTNYFAAFFASLALFFVGSQLYFFIFSENIEKSFLFVLYYIMSLYFLFPYKISIRKNIFDTYFFHSVSFLVNLVCIFSFFIFVDFSILLIGLFLLMESVYFASSYYSLKK